MHVLLTSVFGPFAQDDAYGSRAINPLESGSVNDVVTRVTERAAAGIRE